jgi:hypothetical protein
MQTKQHSLLEVMINTLIGLFGSWLIAYGVMTAIEDRALASMITVAGCTVWSVARGWTVRRVFNRWEYKWQR